MTRHRELATRWEYRCDVCGDLFIWQEGAAAFSSVAMEEHRPDLVPTVCSEPCRAEFARRMEAGTVEVPEVKPSGYTGHRVIGKRRGY